MKASVVLAQIAAAFIATAGFAESPLTIVADEWPPFSGEALPERGMSVDVISTVLAHAGYTSDAQILPWARIMSGSRDGQYYIVGSLFFEEEIADYMIYSDPFFTTQVRFVHAAGTDHVVSSLEALAPYSIAVGDGFLYQRDFDKATHLNKVVVTTTAQAVQMVAFGRVDLTLDSEDVLRFTIANSPSDISGKVEIMPYVLASYDIHMAVRRSLPGAAGIVADFNAALAAMKSDGSLDALLAKHTHGG